MQHNENSRVKIPAIVHLERLGYRFVNQNDHEINTSNNIFLDILKESLIKINPGVGAEKINDKINKLEQSLENDDLGRQFLNLITKKSEVTVIDFNNLNNNNFNVVTELKYSKTEGEEFYPDITVLINGLPLSFIEVKKPNNKDGMLAEKNRMDSRYLSKHNKGFWNVTQLMIFSNNMEYLKTDQNQKIIGSYYSTPNYKNTVFNYFREEEDSIYNSWEEVADETIDVVLKATNLQSIKGTNEFITNNDPFTPVNKFLTSLLSRERFLFFIKYGLAVLEYMIEEKTVIEKHIIRYPQYFAIKSLEQALDSKIKKGIIWHTQGSGKTALSFHSVKFLNDYFAKNNVVSKFYFIVDRLDLLDQAKIEFTKRGLSVNTINSKEEFKKEFTTKKAKSSNFNESNSDSEVTVVNVQKFSDEISLIQTLEYDIDFQRVYFIDEAHRSYKREGNFFTNLVTADRSAIMISLTGTPRLKGYLSKEIFGDYIHTYYYNKSIQDGFTLRLMREDIKSSFKLELDEIVNNLEVKVGTSDKSKIMSHVNIVEPLTEYITDDIQNSRKLHDDFSIGGMIVAYDSPQARAIYKQLNEKHKDVEVALILHDEGDKTSRKLLVEDYKKGKIDLVIVDRMLLTGFDAPRLKKLYLCRTIINLSLLQTLTRVNRPYNNFKFGYIVDFADITKEFEKTNQDYLKELKESSPESFEHIDTFFISEEEVKQKTLQAMEGLFMFNTENLEEFSNQVDSIEDKDELLLLKNNLETIKNVYNIARQESYADALKSIDIKTIRRLLTMVALRIGTVNKHLSLEDNESTQELINYMLNTTNFSYIKKGEEELKIVDEVILMQKNIADEISKNIDSNDPLFINLIQEFRRIAKKSNMTESSENSLKEFNTELISLYKNIKDVNSKNSRLQYKYEGDSKFVRIHKRILDGLMKDINQIDLVETLNDIKVNIDEELFNNMKIIYNNDYFLQAVKQHTSKSIFKYVPDQELVNKVSNLIRVEYENEFKDSAA